MRVSVIGQGYVGLNLAIEASKVGNFVRGVETSALIVESISKGSSHIEGVSNQDICKVLANGNYSITSDMKLIGDSDVIVIAVPTPLNKHRLPDLLSLESACISIGRNLNKRALIINESTSYPGTLRNVIKPLIERESNTEHLFAVSPERVDPGNSDFRLRNTPRIIGGISIESLDKAIDFYKSFCDNIVPVSSAEVAEAAKLLENSFRFVNIGFINEFARIMSKMAIPTTEVINAASTKPFGFMKFVPSAGIGGHCIPVDPIYLQLRASEFGIASRFLQVAEDINKEMPSFICRRLSEVVGGVAGKRILLIGITYKPNIADTRESAAIPILDELRALGAQVSWHDPLVKEMRDEKSSAMSGDFDLGLVVSQHKCLNFEDWCGSPLYTITADSIDSRFSSLLDFTRL